MVITLRMRFVAVGQALAAALLILCVAGYGSARSEQRVLVVTTFAAGDHHLGPVVEGIRESLSSRSGLRLSVEHLDVEHNQSKEHLARITEFLSVKYAEAQVNVIVALGGPALQYALRSRGETFTDVPIIFGEVPDLDSADADSLPRATGVLSSHALDETLSLMRELHPKRRKVFVIDDNTARSVWLRKSMERAQQQFSDHLEFRDSIGLTMAELEQELARLGAEDIVFYLSLTKDAAGEPFEYLGALGRVSRASAAPVYGALESMAGFGVVGGYMLSPREIGLQIGNQLLKVLDGTNIDTIPLVGEAPHRYVFDFRQMERFGISGRDLPSGSTIIDEPDTFYYNYRHYFLAALAVFLAMVAYILVLLSGVAKLEKARRGLERLISEGEAPLPIDRPSDALAALAGRLNAVVPNLTQVSFYRSPGGEGQSGALVPVSADAGEVGAPDPELAQHASASHRNQFRGADAMLVLDSGSIPADLAYCRSRRKFDPVDQRMIDLLIRNVAIECDNLQAARLTSSLETAREIQEAILPKNFEEMSRAFDFDLHAMIRPAHEVGGDLYDFFAIDADRLCVLVGDVSDKGVPAAMFMSITRTLIRAIADSESNPRAILEKANAILSAENPSLMFVTLFIAVIDRISGRVDYVNAGHNAPFIRQADGSVEMIPVESNIAIGVLEAAEFTAQSLTLSAGATLLLYTDGVSEAENTDAKQFGETRLSELLAIAPAKRASDLVDRVVDAVVSFAGEAPQSDDITVFALTRAGAGPGGE